MGNINIIILWVYYNNIIILSPNVFEKYIYIYKIYVFMVYVHHINKNREQKRYVTKRYDKNSREFREWSKWIFTKLLPNKTEVPVNDERVEDNDRRERQSTPLIFVCTARYQAQRCVALALSIETWRASRRVSKRWRIWRVAAGFEIRLTFEIAGIDDERETNVGSRGRRKREIKTDPGNAGEKDSSDEGGGEWTSHSTHT